MKALYLSAILLTASSAFATEAVARKVASGGCTDKITSNVSININDKAPNLKEAKAVFDNNINQVKAMAKEAGIEELFVQSLNYSLNPNQHYPGHGGKPIVSFYNISGSINLRMDNEEQTMKFAEFLTKKDIHASVNMNSYKTGNCN